MMPPSSDDRQGAAPRSNPAPRRRLLAFAVVLVVCGASALGYVGYAAWRARAAAAATPIVAVPVGAMPLAAAGPGPQLMFRSTALGESYGRVSLKSLDGHAGRRLATPLQCDRVHFAAGHGICLEARRGALTTYHAHLFDREFSIRHSLALAGPPSRARVSADGRLAAMTVFVSGHSYASTGFTTRTSVVDTETGRIVADELEGFQVLRDGTPFKAADFNFWGVTFARQSNRFYATLGTGGKVFLVEGDLAARRMRVIHADVECPSLSPDGTRIAFKRRTPTGSLGRFVWRLHVLELATARETALAAETRNVDDQVEWLGQNDIVYALPDDDQPSSAATNVWRLAADGSAAPTLLMPLAFSPVVIP